ncbi:hypothetical protein [Streptomyces bullii]|uniref:Uncharacterized protein n=1 Tax=Streptomyces bullii TaxID=349910 RepID=A0ABW0UL10_9ACTN
MTDQTPSDLENRLRRAVRDALRALPSAQFINFDAVVGVVAGAVQAEVQRVVSGPAATEATERETTTRVFAALHRSAEQDVTRVIALYEQWVKAGPPPLGTSIARWWDARLVELREAIRPPIREQRERPTHSDGTPYSYAEITAEGWDHCDGCRTWTTATPERPHQCPQTHMRGPVTDQPKEH